MAHHSSLLLALGLLASLALVLAEDYTCPAVTDETEEDFGVGAGDSFSFHTNDGGKYARNMQCQVNYIMDASCKKMKFSCNPFRLGKGDFLYVQKGNGRPKKFKKNKMKAQQSNGDMSVRFTSNKKKEASGARCTIKCVKAAPGATTPTGPGSGSGNSTASSGYSKAWLRGEGPAAHVHEGVRLADGSGWVAIGDTLIEGHTRSRAVVRAVDNEAATRWTTKLGDNGNGKYSVGYSVIEGSTALYAGVGLWSADTGNKQKAAVVALDKQTGAVLWTRVLGAAQAQHGGARSCVMDGADIVCAGYVRYGQTGFVFVADEGRPAVWRLNSAGDILTETFLEVEGMGQVAKIRKDAAGFVLCSTAWSVLGGQDVNVVAVVKLSSSLAVEWSQTYGLAGGNSQVFDMLVDREGHYLLGGHTTVGEGVVNWGYLALRVDSQTRQVLWRKAWGQPRGFDARYIHDEMYGVALDNDGNYLLLGGSGDEYSYSAQGAGQWAGWTSDVWGSYLVVADPGTGDTLSQGFWGDKGGNNAGEWLSYDAATGEIMVYTDSDTSGGFGFLKLTPVQ